MNFLTVSFSDEDRARIDRLAAALEVLAGSAFQVAMYARPTEAAAVPESEAEQAAVCREEAERQGFAPVQEPHPVADPFPAPAPVTLAEFQKQLTLACAASADMKASVRALINEYAPAASSVPEDKRAEVLARLAAL